MDFIYSHYTLIVFPLIAVTFWAAFIAAQLKTLSSKIVFAILAAVTVVCMMALPIHAWEQNKSDSMMGIVLTICIFGGVVVGIVRGKFAKRDKQR